jgi:hypothetical protein
MINSIILNITILATTTCNSNILDVLKSKMNGKKVAAKHVLAEHDEQKNSSRPHVPFICRCSHCSNIVDHNVGEERSKQTAMKTAIGCTARLGRKMTRDEELEQSCSHAERFPKT